MADDGPSYQEIADDLRRRIKWGEIPTRRYLAERDLMDRYLASCDAIREAIEVLTAEKLLKSEPGNWLKVTGTVDPLAFVPDADRASASGGPHPAGSRGRGAWLRIAALGLQVVFPAGVICLISTCSARNTVPPCCTCCSRAVSCFSSRGGSIYAGGSTVPRSSRLSRSWTNGLRRRRRL